MEIEVALRAAAVIAGAAALGQIVSRRLPIPLPVFLLAAGLLLGHDGLGIVETAEIEDLVSVSVTLAVALIVFEGGTVLRLPMLRLLAPTVRNLVLGGLVITTLVGALAGFVFLDFGWRVALLFGALVVVTGPSVITPLLRSVRVSDRINTVLASEGVIIDPLGALLTLFLLDIAIAESFDPAGPTRWVIERIVVGVGVGAIGAAVAFGIGRGGGIDRTGGGTDHDGDHGNCAGKPAATTPRGRQRISGIDRRLPGRDRLRAARREREHRCHIGPVVRRPGGRRCARPGGQTAVGGYRDVAV